MEKSVGSEAGSFSHSVFSPIRGDQPDDKSVSKGSYSESFEVRQTLPDAFAGIVDSLFFSRFPC